MIVILPRLLKDSSVFIILNWMSSEKLKASELLMVKKVTQLEKILSRCLDDA
jgi:hypothetical protein